MCEVRRVFHNVNTDSNKVIALTSTRKPIVKQSTETTKNQLFQKGENEVPVFAKENETNISGEKIKAKKTQKVEKNDFSEPKLLTSLKIIESLRDIGNEKKSKKSARSTFQSQGNNRKQQASKRVNIPFEEKVYKGLIELQVTDEDLGLQTHIPLKPKEFTKIKEPEPVLSDFFKPKFDKEYIVKPTVPKFEIGPVFITEIPSVLSATKRWEPEVR